MSASELDVAARKLCDAYLVQRAAAKAMAETIPADAFAMKRAAKSLTAAQEALWAAADEYERVKAAAA